MKQNSAPSFRVWIFNKKRDCYWRARALTKNIVFLLAANLSGRAGVATQVKNMD